MITTCRRLNPTAFNAWVWRRLADYSHPLEVYYGGAGSGKSYGAAQKNLYGSYWKAIEKCLVAPHDKYLGEELFSKCR